MLVKDPVNVVRNEIDCQTKRLHQIDLLVESVENACIFHPKAVVSYVSQTSSIVVLDGLEILPSDLCEVELFKLVVCTRVTELVGPLVSFRAKYDLCAYDLVLLCE